MYSVISVMVDSLPGNTKIRESTRSWTARVRLVHSWAAAAKDALITTSLAISAVAATAEAAAMSLAPLDPRFLGRPLGLPVCSERSPVSCVEPSIREALDKSLCKRQMRLSSWPSNWDPGREHAAKQACFIHPQDMSCPL